MASPRSDLGGNLASQRSDVARFGGDRRAGEHVFARRELEFIAPDLSVESVAAACRGLPRHFLDLDFLAASHLRELWTSDCLRVALSTDTTLRSGAVSEPARRGVEAQLGKGSPSSLRAFRLADWVSLGAGWSQGRVRGAPRIPGRGARSSGCVAVVAGRHSTRRARSPRVEGAAPTLAGLGPPSWLACGRATSPIAFLRTPDGRISTARESAGRRSIQSRSRSRSRSSSSRASVARRGGTRHTRPPAMSGWRIRVTSPLGSRRDARDLEGTPRDLEGTPRDLGTSWMRDLARVFRDLAALDHLQVTELR